ncbi:MAG: recombinase family protein [Oscillospiraceae bacterium]|nr:recombinase family protein [Oscillospiraceae bacterium]
MKIAVYSRKSKFTGKGESIENQIALCKEYIKTHIPNAAEDDVSIYEDEGFSGKNFDRPQFKKMMKTAENAPFDYIVVYRLDRISRSVGDFANLIEKLNEMKTAFVCIKEQFDTSTPMGRAMMNISAVFAQLERETIAERIRDNIVLLAKTGRWLGGVTPLGFTGEKVEIKDPENKRRFAFKLSPIKSEIFTVKTIYARFLESHSLTKTVTWLISHGIKTRKKNDFRARTVKDILKNPVYCTADGDAFEYFEELGCDICFTKEEADGKQGIMPFLRTSQSGKKTRRNTPEEWIIAIGKHKGIISSEDWIKTQNLLGKNSSKTFYKPSRNSTAIFTGLVKCGECGHNMRPRLSGQNKGNDPRKFTYMCEYKERSRRSKCRMRNASGNMLDESVITEILKLGQLNDLTQKELTALLNSVKNEKLSENINEMKKQISEKEKMISKLMNSFAASENSSSYEYVKRETEKIDNEIKCLREELMHINNSEKQTEILNIECIVNELMDFKKSFTGLSIIEKRDFVNKVIEKIVWDGEKANVYLK